MCGNPLLFLLVSYQVGFIFLFVNYPLSKANGIATTFFQFAQIIQRVGLDFTLQEKFLYTVYHAVSSQRGCHRKCQCGCPLLRRRNLQRCR